MSSQKLEHYNSLEREEQLTNIVLKNLQGSSVSGLV